MFSKRKGKIFLHILLPCEFLILLSGCSGAVFVVNGEGIPRNHYEGEVQRRLDIIRQKQPKELKGDRSRKTVSETEREVATELIRGKLIEQEAKRAGIASVSEEAKRRLQEEMERKGYDKFRKGLTSAGITEEEHLKEIGDKILLETLSKKATRDVTVSEDDAESFYLIHKELFSTQPMVEVAHILVESEGQAKMVAEAAKRREDFSTLAKQVSTDEATKNSGGLLGWIEKGTMEPAFEEACFSLKIGETSGVVKASDGFHVIKVIDRRDAYTPPFSKVKDEVIKTLLSRKREEKFKDWLRTVYANARVEIPKSIGRWDPAIGMVVDSH
ncbi:MAG: peptidylprolyl isomerase [Actinomycetota bacterium]|nr:peptidylprolyl isomerase [Actinomycetota bacterium]